MSNPLHPKVPIEIGGHRFFLRYEYRDFAKAEGVLGFPVYGPPAADLWRSNRIAYINGILLFVGLMNCAQQVWDAIYPLAKQRGTLTLDDALSLITHENASRIEQEVAAAFRKFVPDETETSGSEEATGDAPLSETPQSGGTNSTASAGHPLA